ncbi:MAG TPA: beta-propeller fold lactonase family protein, partial [Candidatus Binataceae bacterium]|nr:beta-propeller fold lactonase family protein [Candidatus Binataceae bacterium]
MDSIWTIYFRQMTNSIRRTFAPVLVFGIITIALIAGCNVPAVTNVGPIASGEAANVSLTQFAAGAEPIAIAITPDGRYLYAPNVRDGTISGYTVLPSGSLVPILGSPFQTGLHPVAVCITSNGRYVYVASAGEQIVLGYESS